MINSLYQLSNKGSFANPFVYFSVIFNCGFLSKFKSIFDRTSNSTSSLDSYDFWGLINLWIHGIGFDIRRAIWQLVFLPFIGYFTTIIAIVQHWFYKNDRQILLFGACTSNEQVLKISGLLWLII